MAGTNKPEPKGNLGEAVGQADTELALIEEMLGIEQVKDAPKTPIPSDVSRRLDAMIRGVNDLVDRLAAVKRRVLGLKEALG